MDMERKIFSAALVLFSSEIILLLTPCEHLIALETDLKELSDCCSIVLCPYGFYEESLDWSTSSSTRTQRSHYRIQLMTRGKVP
ncbi:unnamed protein product [Ilex paraguariensis]|uniref:Secreted protein n=1 Tax=Ilex paraguariensis TaxID=185542 RepID=A0ABC8TTY4_9AQUA